MSTEQPTPSNPIPGWHVETVDPSQEARGADGRKPRRSSNGDAPTQADNLIELACELYRLGRTKKAEPFAVRREGANIAQMLGNGSGSFKDDLASAYYRRFGRAPNSSAIADALNVLKGSALQGEAERVHLRVAPHAEGQIIVDLGDTRGRCVVVKPDGWQVLDRSPVLFRRTELVGEIPAPVPGGAIEELRTLLNVSDDHFWLLVGWLVSALIPEVSHPMLLITGEAGTGKTTAAKFLRGLIDDGPAPTCRAPSDANEWEIAACGRWVVALDNLSSVPDWLSDALCRAVTGDGSAKRMLYTNGDIYVVEFKRCIIANGIELASLRGDLGSRVLMIDLQPIDPTRRLWDQRLNAQYEACRPRIFGALLDLLAKVLSHLPDVQLEKMGRLADFARVLAAIDEATDGRTRTLAAYEGQESRIADDVISSDPFIEAVANAFLAADRVYDITAGEVLGLIKQPAHLPKNWPTSARGAAHKLKRNAGHLRKAGLVVEAASEETRKPGGNRDRLWRIGVEGRTVERYTPRQHRHEQSEDDCPFDDPGPARGVSEAHQTNQAGE